MPVIVSQTPSKSCYYQSTNWPRVVHGHADVGFIWTSSNLHGPDKRGSVAGNGHGSGDPPGEHEHRVPEDT